MFVGDPDPAMARRVELLTVVKHVVGRGPGDDSSPHGTTMQRTDGWRNRMPLPNERACLTNEWLAKPDAPTRRTQTARFCLSTWRGHQRTAVAFVNGST